MLTIKWKTMFIRKILYELSINNLSIKSRILIAGELINPMLVIKEIH